MSQMITLETVKDEEYIKTLKSLCQKSTQVVGWYSHNYSPIVKGPFGRWATFAGGDNGMKDPVKYPVPVAEPHEDAAFCAAAMSSLPALLELLEEKDQKIAELKADIVKVLESGPSSVKR